MFHSYKFDSPCLINTEISKEGVWFILAVEQWESVGDKILDKSDTLEQFLCTERKEVPFVKRNSD
jgi:hypothetical protein